MIHPTIMFRRSFLPKRANLYKIKYSANNDLYTFFEFLRRGKFANMAEKLIYYRIHGKNDSLTNPRDRFLNTLKIRIDAAIHYGYRPTVKSVFLTAVQLAVVMLLPESLSIPLYLWAKGIYNPFSEVVNRFKDWPNYRLRALRYLPS